MSKFESSPPASSLRGFWPAAIVFLAAIAAGLPAVRGGFTGGDDQQLVLNFVLVSRPSLSHALELLKLAPHRYLYQPVPMLTFAAEFAILKALGLSPLPDAPNSATWLFHLTNILIHAASAVLVWRVVRRLHPNPLVGLVAAVLFAVHPMGMESTAWLCGRMISLSTFFSLLALDRLLSWEERPGIGSAMMVLLLTVLAMTSKVQVGLPALMLLLPVARRRWPRRTWWMIWGGCALITAGFALLNVLLTRQTGLLEAAAESLHGPRMVRVLAALAWYLQRIVWPSGLAPFHPAQPVVAWSDPGVLAAVLTVVFALAVCIGSLRWTRVGALGLLWFLAAVGATLPVIPSRNTMVAERYVYLASVGLYWAAAAFLVAVYQFWAVPRRVRMWAMGSVGVAMILGLAAVSWHTAGVYHDDITRNTRVAAVYPEVPASWALLASAYYEAGRYPEAIRVAERGLGVRTTPASSRCLQIAGMSYLKMNRSDQAIRTLQAAAEAGPGDPRTDCLLAEACLQAGQKDKARWHYSRALERSPRSEAALLGLAQLLRSEGETEETLSLYDRILKENPFQLTANLAMAEIEIGHKQYGPACSRLQRVLSYAPESWQAWTNLGVCRSAMNDRRSAVEAYRQALAVNPQAETAAINLAGLLVQAGQTAEAVRTLDTGLAVTSNRGILWAANDLLVGAGQIQPAARLWWQAMNREPQAADLKAAYAWACVTGLRWDEARRYVESASESAAKDPLIPMIRSMLSLAQGDPAAGVAWLRSLGPASSPAARESLARMRQALAQYGQAHPDDPWSYYLASQVLRIEGNQQTADLLLQRFKDLTRDTAYQQKARELGITP